MESDKKTVGRQKQGKMGASTEGVSPFELPSDGKMLPSETGDVYDYLPKGDRKINCETIITIRKKQKKR